MGNNPRRATTARACKALFRAVNRSIAASHTDFSSNILIESLENRQMLSTTVPASRAATAKLDSSLTSLYQSYLQPSSSSSTTESDDSLLEIVNGSVQLQNFAKAGDHDELVAALKRLKATNLEGKGREIDALVPISSLGKLAKVGSLRFTQPTESVVNSGAVTSQGDTADQAAAARTAFGITGAGVKVGIVSDSFNNSQATTDKYADDVASGDLPSNVQILNEGPTTATDEGRAIAQVIYDSAPGASLAFSTGYGGVATMAASIKALTTAGAKVIVDDVTYLNEPMFQDGTIAQAVATATAAGVTYISAAGNLGSDSYASAWKAATNLSAGSISNASGAPAFYGGAPFNFGTTGSPANMNSFQLASGASIKLSFQWDSPYFSVSGGAGTTNQLDAYVLNAAGTQIVGGAANYVVGTDPIQTFQFTNTTGSTATYNLMLVNEGIGATPGYVKYVDFSGQATNWAFAPSSSTIFGHANAAGSETVGAVSYANTPAYGVTPPVLESYSGTGGTQILFNSAGGRLTTPITRQEPAIVAPDAVFTTFYGTKLPGNAYPTFSGTSAAAASAAGIAALIIQKSPTLTPAGVDSALQTGAIALTSTTPNLQSGYGLVQATSSISSFVANITGEVFIDSNGNATLDSGETGDAGVTVYIDTNKNGVEDAGEPVTTTSASGTFSFYNQPTGTLLVRVASLFGFVATSPAGKSVTLSTAGSTASGVNLGLFPDVFTNTNPGVTYTLAVTPSVTPTQITLVTQTKTYTAPLSILPSFAFNLGGGTATLNVNFSSGSPVPPGGILYSGGAGTTGNKLILNGTANADNFAVYGQSTIYNTSTGVPAQGVTSTVSTSNIQSEVINGAGGNDIFSIEAAPLPTTNLTFNGATGSSETLTVDDALPNNGTGVTFNAGSGSIANTLNVNVGNFTFQGNPAATAPNLTVNVKNTPNSVNVSSGVIFAAGALGSGINVRTLTALNISPGSFNVDPDAQNVVPPSPDVVVAAPASHADRAVLIVGSLSITNVSNGTVSNGITPNGNAVLDLNGNDMIVTTGNAAAINTLLHNGFNNGGWNGSFGIISSAAASDTTHLTAIGSLSNNNAGSPLYSSGTALGTFDGQSPANTAVLLKYTYYGDADLSGKVDAGDYSRIDSAFSQSTGTGWANGDFNYDNVINGSDYTLIDNAFNTQGAPL